jgi:glycosyltransferase involved in cell wall biosynthesis
VVAGFHVQPENLLLNIGVRWRWLAAWLYRRWVAGFFQLADAVVCPSTFAADRLRAFGLTVPTWVVSNGAPPRRVRSGLRQPPAPGAQVVVLALGRLAREKRQDVIIDAVARCRHRAQIRLVVAGTGPLEQALRARAQRQGLPVEIGYVSEERLNHLFAEAHLFVHASEVELEGMAVLEAMSMGLPVLVANALQSAARCFASGPEFLFQPGDADDLAARLDALLDTPRLLLAGSQRSLEQSVQHDFQRSVRSLEHIYSSVVGYRALFGMSALHLGTAGQQGAL